ncbi:MAG TPA: hypothetical protein VF995_09995, partial [Actinomycetota bacterium]
LEQDGRIMPGAFATTLHQFSNQLHQYQMQPHQITIPERPPIVTLDVYRRRREAQPAGQG